MAVNSISVTNTSAITVTTVGTQGLTGPSSILGRGFADLTADSTDDGYFLVYDHDNTRWDTNKNVPATTITAATAFVPDASDGATLGTAALEFSDLFLADGAVINFGDDQDVSLTHVADTGLLLSSTDRLQFGDSGTYIHQSADGVLDLVSDNEVEINGTTIDINGNVDISGTLTVAGALDFSDAAITNVGSMQLDSISGDADTNTSITFSGSDVITVAAAGANQITFTDGAIIPSTDNDIDLGTNSVEFKDAYFDGTVTSDAFAGPLTGEVTGNAATATALATARTIGGTSFDGTANIAVALSATSTALASARTIGGTSFDGTANIVPATITVADTTDTSSYVSLFESATGDLAPKTDAAITYNAGTGTLASTFSGNITGNVTGNTSGSSGSCAGLSATATALATSRTIGGTSFDGTGNIVPVTITVADTSDTTSYVGLFESATGDIGPKTDGGITYNAGTGALTATSFVGPITGNASSATVATTVTITDNESTNESNAIIFTSGGDVDGGNIGLESDGTLTYNPSTGKITATGFVGTLTGNVTGNVTGNTSGSSGSCTGLSATVTALASARTIGGTSFDGTANIVPATITVADTTDSSSYVGLFESATGDLAPKTDAAITYNASNGSLTATTFVGALTGNASGSSGSCTGNAATATALASGRTIGMTGDVVWTSASFDGSGNVTGAATIQANSVALGTDTTGNYIATVAGTSNEVTVSGSGSETATITIGLPDDVTIAGDLTVNGDTVTVNTATLSVEDPLIILAKSNNAADSVDIGFYGLYDTSGSQDLYAGLFRDANDSGKWKLFKDLQPEPTTTVNTSGTGYAVGTLVSNLEGNVTGNVTGNTSGTAATVTTAAQSSITSLGTLTTLTVDNVIINGSTIGHTGDTDLLTVASGILTVAGEVSATTLDIGGTDVTSTAAELNILDGVGSTAAELNILDGSAKSTSSITIADADGFICIDGTTTKQIPASDLKTFISGVASVITVADTTDTSCSVGLWESATGDIAPKTDGAITYNAGTGLLSSTGMTASGTVTYGSLSDGSITVTAFVDEDDMSSDSATLVPTQQSVKAYVDAVDQTMGSGFVIEDDDGTEVTITESKEMKVIGSGVTTNWTDTSTGSDGDPYDLTISVNAAQTAITSIYATDLVMGEDSQTAIDFGTANEIDFKVDNAARLTLTSSALYPVTDNQIDLGTSSLEFKDAFFDGTVTADAFAGPLTGDVTGNASGTAATVTTAAQTNITSLGTLTTLTVDNVIINGTNIGHTSDTDSMAIASDGVVTFSQIPVLPANTIDSDHYVDGSIDTAHIADNQVTLAKMAGLARGKIIYGDSSGDPTALAVGSANYVLTSDGTDISWASGGGMTSFQLEDDDGTEVAVSDAKEVKFIGSGITTNWTDTDNGTDGDPYDLTFTVDAAQTGITSIYATDLIMGEDSQTAIDFGTANEIDFKVDNAARLTLTTGALYPVTDNQIDLGTSSLEFKDAFFDGTVTADAFAGPLTGNVTGNASGTAATVTTAAQSNITSLGTLTTLTVDNVIINGTTIGHTDNTDTFTLDDSGNVALADGTKLGWGGTNNAIEGAASADRVRIYTNSAVLRALFDANGITGYLNDLSDQALKENIADITDATATVKALQGRTFDWIENSSSDAGFIAQEVATVLPNAVVGEEGQKAIRVDNIVAHIVTCIQELEARIAALES